MALGGDSNTGYMQTFLSIDSAMGNIVTANSRHNSKLRLFILLRKQGATIVQHALQTMQAGTVDIVSV